MMKNSKHFYLLLAVLCLATLPWLGMADFYTKGEPREAIVGQTMIDQLNWILPHNNGGEMAYKPPFFHWMVALFSLPAGYVTTWSARLPSALACIVLIMWTYSVFARWRDSSTALLAALLTFSTFEVFRAAYACRVDMMLALGMAGAMLAFFEWSERQEERRGLPWMAILMMSVGTLSKGPVAVVLPCAVTGVYMLLRRRSFFNVMGWMVLCAMLALVPAAAWYAAAWAQGGEEFLNLVMEENVGRFLGKMTYRSHENGLWYYFVMLPAGLLPWSIPALWAAWKKRKRMSAPKAWLALSPETLYSMVAVTVIFIFYCIPLSKRGVYLLPLYPFMGWLVALALKDVCPDRLSARFSEAVHYLWLRVAFAITALFTLAFALVVPLLMHAKSDRDIARDIAHMQIPEDAPLTSYIANNVKGNMMHFFTINFYLRDRLGYWDGSLDSGYILLNDDDVAHFKQLNPGLQLQRLYRSAHKSCDTRRYVELYQFSPARSISK